ncbi:hypothetical protein V5O48_011512 [Marasmius crinis-equi]|uniref:Uncharacterized protein n=1 Tax=Marasmius crinis-equi TaxID=585013 RepID=A0ABR3F5D0_9AGAR
MRRTCGFCYPALRDLPQSRRGGTNFVSDFSVKKTKRRNRLGIEKLGKMSKVGANIRSEHLQKGLTSARVKRSNHDEDAVLSLLHVPQYADLLDAGDSGVAELDDEGSAAGGNSKSSKGKAEYSDEAPDDGELEGSGDDYEG